MQTVNIKNIYIQGNIYLIISNYQFIFPNLKLYYYVITINNKLKCTKKIFIY